SARKPSFPAALRCQQQRSEIMNTVSRFVNNFFTSSLRLQGSSSSALQASNRTSRTTRFPLPRRIAVSAKEA
ncbi:hypothetical protein, partial [Burkholderia ubonensis]|uniref:hypothetical protein n=1 Tax=Burkholderia ubonensis TaxID=101571 RepID=UPI001E3FE848